MSKFPGGIWGLICLGLIAVFVYQIFIVGNPEAKRFLDECHRRELHAIRRPHSAIDYETVAAECNLQYRNTWRER